MVFRGSSFPIFFFLLLRCLECFSLHIVFEPYCSWGSLRKAWGFMVIRYSKRREAATFERRGPSAVPWTRPHQAMEGEAARPKPWLSLGKDGRGRQM